MAFKRAWSRGLRFSRRVGLDIVRTGYSSPVPDVRTIEANHWVIPGELPGITLDLGAQLSFLESSLAVYVDEFKDLVGSGGLPYFRMDNRQYGPGDADTLFAMVRFAKPSRVVEVGSGHSTYVTAGALERNAADGVHGALTAIDPHPRIDLAERLSTKSQHLSMRLEEVPLATFTSLRNSDVLFVDSSHVSKAGSDVNRLLLEIIPRLATGVWIHLHDIFLPWEYPRRLIDAERKYWNEQYLLQAMLSGNGGFDVKLALYALSRAEPERLTAAVRSLGASDSPGAFWIRRT